MPRLPGTPGAAGQDAGYPSRFCLACFSVDDASDEITSRYVSQNMHTELGFELDAYTIPAALLALRIEFGADYQSFMEWMQRVKKSDRRKGRTLYGPIVCGGQHLCPNATTLYELRQKYGELEFTELSLD